MSNNNNQGGLVIQNTLQGRREGGQRFNEEEKRQEEKVVAPELRGGHIVEDPVYVVDNAKGGPKRKRVKKRAVITQSSLYRKDSALALKKLKKVIIVCAVFLVFEFTLSQDTNGLALFTDVIDLSGDLIALTINVMAIKYQCQKQNNGLQFDYKRTEYLGVFLSSIITVVFDIVIGCTATERLIEDSEYVTEIHLMWMVALIALFVNVFKMHEIGGDCRGLGGGDLFESHDFDGPIHKHGRIKCLFPEREIEEGQDGYEKQQARFAKAAADHKERLIEVEVMKEKVVRQYWLTHDKDVSVSYEEEEASFKQQEGNDDPVEEEVNQSWSDMPGDISESLNQDEESPSYVVIHQKSHGHEHGDHHHHHGHDYFSPKQAVPQSGYQFEKCVNRKADLKKSFALLIICALLAYDNNWYRLDAWYAVLCSLFCIYHSIPILCESFCALMGETPDMRFGLVPKKSKGGKDVKIHIDVEEFDIEKLRCQMENIRGVIKVMDLNIWAMTPGNPSLTCTLVKVPQAHEDFVLENATLACRESGVKYSIIQVENVVCEA